MSGISLRLREALSGRFGEAVRAASEWEAPPVQAEAAYRRAADTPMTPMVLHEKLSALASMDVPEPDEVDKLFLDQ